MRDFDGVGDIIEYSDPFVILDSINKPRERCKLLCKDFPRLRPGYDNGKKYCPRCEKFILTAMKFCWCCGCQLRGKPIDIHLKEKRIRKKQATR